MSTFQHDANRWARTCFGSQTIDSNSRFLEEALELVQALGLSVTAAHNLVDYVYGRPAGDPAQEVGGVMITLATLCQANGLHMDPLARTELQRCWDNIEQIRTRTKPK